MKEKKFTFGKTIVLIAYIIFIICLLYMLTHTEIDSSLCISVISATGSLVVTTTIFYLKKSTAENLNKLNMVAYKAMTNNRFEYNKKMLKLRQQYGVDQTIIDEIEAESDADEFMDAMRDRTINDLNTATDDAHTLPEKVDII